MKPVLFSVAKSLVKPVFLTFALSLSLSVPTYALQLLCKPGVSTVAGVEPSEAAATYKIRELELILSEGTGFGAAILTITNPKETFFENLQYAISFETDSFINDYTLMWFVGRFFFLKFDSQTLLWKLSFKGPMASQLVAGITVTADLDCHQIEEEANPKSQSGLRSNPAP